MLDTLPFGDGFRRTLPRRPPLTLAGVLAAMAGAMLAAACLTLLSTFDDPSPWLLVVVGIGLAVVGWAFALVVELSGARFGPRTTELVPLGTVLAVIGVPRSPSAWSLRPPRTVAASPSRSRGGPPSSSRSCSSSCGWCPASRGVR